MSSRVIVVGGGAAGILAAGTAAQSGADVTLIERNERVARKVMITGKGRCNVTNFTQEMSDLIDHVPINGRFLYSAFSQFMPSDTIDFFESLGVKLKMERGNRVFPQSDKAVDIVDALDKFLKINKIKRITARVTELVLLDGCIKGVRTESGETLQADHVIVATGGLSYPRTGSTGDGYDLACQVGHTIVTPSPSLVPLESGDEACGEMQGLSLKNIAIKVMDTTKNKVIYSDFGEMIFTHFGISGPVILSASSHMRQMSPGKYQVVIDLKPALSYEQLDQRLQRDFLKFSNKDFSNALGELLPHKMIPVIIKRSGISPGLKVNQITKEMRGILAREIKAFMISISRFRPIDEAVITSGGVQTKEIDPKTMQSRKVKGLSFAGEVMDVDAYTGGYNLQIAFSTGYLAGKKVLEDD